MFDPRSTDRGYCRPKGLGNCGHVDSTGGYGGRQFELHRVNDDGWLSVLEYDGHNMHHG
jgi:hypothetical protein